MKDIRASQRRRVFKAGLIEFSGGGAIRCTVKNLSASGAALEFESALDIPDRLTLCIVPESVKRQCHVIWRDEKRIGVSFE
jgi:PilZ domain